ncbi:hypothetical protein B484DRAFT_436347, partial [Ochromonadaceae sp. CCMP2298]
MDSLGFATCNSLVQYELLPTLEESGIKAKRKDGGTGTAGTAGVGCVGGVGGVGDVGEDGGSFQDEESEANTLYVEHFSISTVTLNVLVTPTRKAQRGSGIRSEGTAGLYSSLSLFFWQVGEVVLDLTSTISDAPISFHRYEESHVFKTDTEIAKFLQDRYLHYAIGVKDFFFEPAHALINTPTEISKIGRGVVKGTVSLVSNTTVGFLGVGTGVTRSVGRGFAKLSMDSAYMRRREELQRPPATFTAAAKRPLLDVSNGFYYAVVGVVKVPYKSVKERGPLGLLPGLAKGVVGLASNPVVGILDAVAHSGDAFRDMLNLTIKASSDPVQRLRLAEQFGPDGRILPYSFPVALGTQILQVLDRMFPDESAGRQADRKPYMVARRNRFSFVASTEEEAAAVLRSDMGLHALGFKGEEVEELAEMGRARASDKAKVASEFVIYAAIIRQTPEMDLVTLLTTERVVVVEYHRHPHSAFLKELWVSPLAQLTAPVFERSGGKATLLLRSNQAVPARKLYADEGRASVSVPVDISPVLESPSAKSGMRGRRNPPLPEGKEGKAFVKANFLLVANYNEEDAIINMHNCLHTVL